MQAGQTPLIIATNHGRESVLSLLLEIKDVNSPDEVTPVGVVEGLCCESEQDRGRCYGFNIFVYIIKRQYTCRICLCLTLLLCPPTCMQDGLTPLMVAVNTNKPAMVKVLLDSKANVNAANDVVPVRGLGLGSGFGLGFGVRLALGSLAET